MKLLIIFCIVESIAVVVVAVTAAAGVAVEDVGCWVVSVAVWCCCNQLINSIN